MSKTMNKVLVMMMIVSLISVITIGGTLAYLTSNDSDVNTFSSGNVDIEQIEQERGDDGTLQDFRGNDEGEELKKLYPATIKLDDDHMINGLWSTANNAVDKLVSVKNTGSSDVYVRTWFAFEYGNKEAFNKVKMNINETDWDWDLVQANVEEIDGSKYHVVCAVYKQILEASDVPSAYSLKQVALDSSATNKDVAVLGDTYEVKVFTQAGQAVGFESVSINNTSTASVAAVANSALNEIFGTEHPWTVKEATLVSTADELIQALSEAQDGDVISVAAGTYDFTSDGTSDGIIVDKAITLQAADETKKPVFLLETANGESAASLYSGIKIKSDDVTLKNLMLKIATESSATGNLVEISPNGTSYYSDITIDGCEFYGSDHCIAMYGNNVTIKNCVLDESTAPSQGNIIYVWGISGDLTIQNNIFIGNNKEKHGISFYKQSSGGSTSKIVGNILIDGNTFSNVYKGIVHESDMTYEDVSVVISNNTFTDYKKKPVAIDEGTFDSYVVSENVFGLPTDTDKIIIDNKVNTSVIANGNYWGYENPTWTDLIYGANVTVENYYSNREKTNLVTISN